MKLSFVTVTFWEDFDLLEQQLSSMDQYVEVSQVHYIILNDDDRHLQELEEIVHSHTCHRYKIITRSQLQDQYPTLIEKPTFGYGWHMQQVLKLVIAKEIETEFYCLLDSKDFFIATCDPAQKFFIDHKPIGVLEVEKISRELMVYQKNSYLTFGVLGATEQCLRSHTPFIMKTSYVLDMVAYLIMHGKSLVRIIEGNSPDLTNYVNSKCCVEFHLYSAWLKLNQLATQYHLVHDLQFNTAFDIAKSKRRKSPLLKIVVCGCSFSSPVLGDLKGTHWAELLAREFDAELIVLARQGISNNAIRLQISEAIKLKPDLVIINSTTPDRIEFPVAPVKVDPSVYVSHVDGVYNPELGLKNFNYPKHKNTMVSETIFSIIDWPKHPYRDMPVDSDVKFATKLYASFLYDAGWKKQCDRWTINSGLWELLNDNIPFLYNHWITGDVDLPNNIREKHTVPCHLDFITLMNRFLVDPDPGYHTTPEGQQFIAEEYAKIIRSRALI